MVGVAIGGWIGACRRTLDAADDWVLWESELAGSARVSNATPTV